MTLKIIENTEKHHEVIFAAIDHITSIATKKSITYDNWKRMGKYMSLILVEQLGPVPRHTKEVPLTVSPVNGPEDL